MGRALCIHQGEATLFAELWWCLWGRGPIGNNVTCSALHQLSVTFPASHKQIGPLWCWLLGVWVYVRSRTQWVSPMNSPVRLRVSPAIPTGLYSQRFWGFISPCWNPGLHGLFCTLVIPPDSSVSKCGTTWSSRHCLAACPLHPGCLSSPLLPVWVNVSSLTPWLEDFYTVWFSGSSGCVLFFNFCPSFDCGRRQSVSTYTSILTRSWMNTIYISLL